MTYGIEFTATVRIRDYYGFKADEDKIRETLKEILEDAAGLDMKVLDIQDVRIIKSEVSNRLLSIIEKAGTIFGQSIVNEYHLNYGDLGVFEFTDELEWLVNDGFVERLFLVNHGHHYRITERGKSHLVNVAFS